MSFADWTNKQVLIKLINVDEPVEGEVRNVDQYGLWVKSSALALFVTQRRPSEKLARQ
jgi:hypothetical protein